MTKDITTIVTHNGTFHIDELFAIACALRVIDGEVEIIRTRDDKIIDDGDWVIDVGGVYDHDARRYDHHQPGAPIRMNGVPYAAFGLVWQHWGSQICGSEKLANKIDTEFVQMLDGPDAGFITSQSTVADGLVPTLGMLPSLWQIDPGANPDAQNKNFESLLEVVAEILDRVVLLYSRREQAAQAFDEAYHAHVDKSVVFVDKGIWPDDVSKYPDVFFVAYQDQENQAWKARCINEEVFKCRRSFPIVWRGKRGRELQQVSGIDGAEFVHAAGFLAVANNKSDLKIMCQKALEE